MTLFPPEAVVLAETFNFILEKVPAVKAILALDAPMATRVEDEPIIIPLVAVEHAHLRPAYFPKEAS